MRILPCPCCGEQQDLYVGPYTGSEQCVLCYNRGLRMIKSYSSSSGLVAKVKNTGDIGRYLDKVKRIIRMEAIKGWNTRSQN